MPVVGAIDSLGRKTYVFREYTSTFSSVMFQHRIRAKNTKQMYVTGPK